MKLQHLASRTKALLPAILLIAASGQAMAQTLDTRSTTPGSASYILGPNGHSYIAQVLVTPLGATSFDNFSFFVSGGEGTNVRARLYTFGNFELYDSGVITVAGGGYSALTFSPNLALPPFQVPIAAILSYWNGGTSDLTVFAQSGDTYLPGDGYYSTDGNNTFPLNEDIPGQDLDFRAEFSSSATPEPGSLVLLGTGFAGMLGVGLRRRRRLTA